MTELRGALLQDLPGVYRVCLQTGDSGADATGRYRNPDLLGHVYAGPYLAGQAALSFVIADRDGVAGYVLAADDTRSFEAWAEREWWPGLRRQYPLSGGAPTDASSSAGEPAGSWADEQMIRLLHDPPRSRDAVLADYPSHLHIDLLPRLQRGGHGRALIEREFTALRAAGSRGVHLSVGTGNQNAIGFYRHLGFEQFAESPDSRLLVRGLL